MSDAILQLNFTGLLLEGDENGWIQLLVLGVLFAVSALSGIIKSRKQKRDLEREERLASTPPARPLRRQEESRAAQQRQASAGPARQQQGGDIQPEATARTQPRTIIRPGSALGAFVAEIKAEIKRAADEMQGISIPPEGPVAPYRPKPVAQAVPAAPPVAHPQPQVRAPVVPKADDLTDILPAFSSPDDLAKAVLYREILGQPVSLREPTDNLIA